MSYAGEKIMEKDIYSFMNFLFSSESPFVIEREDWGDLEDSSTLSTTFRWHYQDEKGVKIASKHFDYPVEALKDFFSQLKSCEFR